jgi:hypothetical protein
LENSPTGTETNTVFDAGFQALLAQTRISDPGQGYSKTAFAGSIGVSRDTILEWAKGYPEFSGAVKQGEAARTRFLEMELLSADTGPRVTSRIFALKNACPDEWRDKQEHAHTGANGGRSKRARLATRIGRGRLRYSLRALSWNLASRDQ